MVDYENVKEQWYMYDTVAITPYNDLLPHPIPGWFSSFNALAATDGISFFDTRNKSIGLAYCNQEARDQIPFALDVMSLSVSFIAPACSSQIGELQGEDTFRGRVDQISAFWGSELPQHTSCVFRVNQDERLKTNCAIVPPCYGPIGSAMGQDDMSASGGFSTSVTAGGMGRAHLKYRWEFPAGIGVPRRATIAVTLRFVEWARAVLGDIWGPGNLQFYDHTVGAPTLGELEYRPSAFLIQVLITGQRQVQQRGEYHA